MDISIKTLFSRVWANIYKNKFTYISIGAILQFVMLVGLWLVGRIFQFALKISGEEHLDKNNIFTIFMNPLSFLLLISLVLVAAFFMFIEFSTLTFTIYGQLTENRYSLRNIVANAWQKMRSLVGVQILFFIGYFILTIPVANIGVKSVISKNLYIPKFITGEIMKTNSGLILWAILMIVFAYVNFRLIFTLPLTAIGDKKIASSIRKSWELTKNGKLKFLITIFLFEIIYVLIVILTILITTVIFVFIDPSGDSLIVQTLFYTVISSVVFFFGVVSKVTVITALITVLIDKGKISQKVVNNVPENKKKSKWLLLYSSLVIVGYTFYNGIILYDNGVNKDIKVIAHRGFVASGVENSLEALEAAAKNGADYVELDVLLTKDNKFVVMHDYNLKRLAGIDKRVQDMNYDEVVGLTIRQGEFTSKIPSFEEYVKKAKDLNVKLLVELKPHGAEPSDYIDIFISKIKELGIESDYKYMSLDLKVIQELESKDPILSTGYVIPLQLGKFSNNNVDFFVIEDFSYRDSLVKQANEENKEVFVWTINDSALITKYLQSPANGIITDELTAVESEKHDLENDNSYLARALRLIDIEE